MQDAFGAGYDPALELATHSAKIRHRAEQEQQERPDLGLEIEDSEPWTQHLRRKEQDVIDMIVKGEEPGHYYVLLGAKVTWYPSLVYGWNTPTFKLGYRESDNDFRCYGIHSSRGRRHVRCASQPGSFQAEARQGLELRV